jgi:hypothetical protein
MRSSLLLSIVVIGNLVGDEEGQSPKRRNEMRKAFRWIGRTLIYPEGDHIISYDIAFHHITLHRAKGSSQKAERVTSRQADAMIHSSYYG